ncbi:hypothetical protein ACS0TY_022208 [Phlomoides rotata]
MAISPNFIVVRQVWGFNLIDELNLVRQCVNEFPIAAFDTEFPGTIFTDPVPFSQLSPTQLYSLMKKNVDSLKLIQLGLTLSDVHGNLLTYGTESRYVWQFNFCDFDPECDPKDLKSIAFLKNQGIDLVKNRIMGIESRTFALKINAYVLGPRSGLTWVTFHGIYDYAYLIKILTGKQLPCTYNEFRMLLHTYFGFLNYDSKAMAKELGLCGGLEKIAKSLDLDRVAGESRQAGSNSLLTMQIFLKLRKEFFPIPVHLFEELRLKLSPLPG